MTQPSAAGSGRPTSAGPGPLTDLSSILAPSREATRADLLAQVAMLEGKLATMPAIEQAKGALMASYGLTADAALAVLRFHSQHRNVKIRAIAAQLITLMRTSPTSADAIARFNRLLDEVRASCRPPLLRRGSPSRVHRLAWARPGCASRASPRRIDGR